MHAGVSNPAVDFNEMYIVFSLIFDERLRQESGGSMLTGKLNPLSEVPIVQR